MEGGPDTRTCPNCAEEVSAAAHVCRFCGFHFDAAPPVHNSDRVDLPNELATSEQSPQGARALTAAGVLLVVQGVFWALITAIAIVAFFTFPTARTLGTAALDLLSLVLAVTSVVAGVLVFRRSVVGGALGLLTSALLVLGQVVFLFFVPATGSVVILIALGLLVIVFLLRARAGFDGDDASAGNTLLDKTRELTFAVGGTLIFLLTLGGFLYFSYLFIRSIIEEVF
jgi:hypothetical protein